MRSPTKVSGSSGSASNNHYGGSAPNQLSNNFFGGGNGTNQSSHGTKDQVQEQTRFNIEELLQIFSTANLSQSTVKRPRVLKGNKYDSLHDALGNSHQPGLGLFHH